MYRRTSDWIIPNGCSHDHKHYSSRSHNPQDVLLFLSSAGLLNLAPGGQALLKGGKEVVVQVDNSGNLIRSL